MVEEPDATAFFVDLGPDDVTLHINVFQTTPLKLEQFRRFNDRFLMICTALAERGVPSVKTIVEEGNEDQERLARFFGFEYTGTRKIITLDNGTEYILDEMEFPLNGY